MKTRTPSRFVALNFGSEDKKGPVRGAGRLDDPCVPDNPLEQRRIRNRLIVLALLIPLARLIALLFS